MWMLLEKQDKNQPVDTLDDFIKVLQSSLVELVFTKLIQLYYLPWGEIYINYQTTNK